MADRDDSWPLVQDAILAFGSEVPDLARARAALVTVIDQEAWKSYNPPIGKRCTYAKFSEWVEAEVPRGLHTTVENLLRIAEGDTKLRDALDEALRNPKGTNQHVDNIHSLPDRPAGTSKDRALRKLRFDAPGLHADVLAGRLSAHAAMVRAGFRIRTFTVRPEPKSAARTLRKHMPPEQLAELARLLLQDKDTDG